jgi:hypothetical protein
MPTDNKDLGKVPKTIPNLALLPPWVIEMHIGHGFSDGAPDAWSKPLVNADFWFTATVMAVGLVASLLAAIFFPDPATLLAGIAVP